MTEYSEMATTLERNPYYYKVDVDGNQIPYIDEYWMQVTSDVEVSNVKVLAGEVDFLREDTALKNLPLYKENEANGGFRTILLKQHVDPTCMFLNLTHEDPTWRAVVGDPRFRRALALGINYTEVIDAVYSGLGETPFMTPGEFKPDEANALLDDLGMTERDGDGFRLAPDGNAFSIPLEVAMHAPDIVPVTEMVVEYWNDLGIRTSMQTIDSTLLSERINANENFGSCVWDVEPMWRTGGWTDYKTGNRWCPLWNTWYNTGGESGEEPPEWVQRILEISEEMMMVTPASPEDIELFDELYQIIYDYIPFIPITQRSLYPLIVNAKLGNVPHAGFGIAANLAGEQMFYKE
jgi:peptide/nickel transport system substrate-binding protein